MRSAEIESFARVTISKDFEDVYAAISYDHEDGKYFTKLYWLKQKHDVKYLIWTWDLSMERLDFNNGF